jgi:hypothetical protein
MSTKAAGYARLAGARHGRENSASGKHMNARVPPSGDRGQQTSAGKWTSEAPDVARFRGELGAEAARRPVWSRLRMELLMGAARRFPHDRAGEQEDGGWSRSCGVGA